jgi:hypothetical protein
VLNMKRLLSLLLFLFPLAALAQQPTLAPSHQYFGGPSLGMVYTDSCTVTGATPQTCNGMRGVVTTGTLTTAAATAASYVINNNKALASSVVLCTEQGYSGTLVTNGYPVIMSCVPGAGTITVNLVNTHAANALNGTIAIGFQIVD